MPPEIALLLCILFILYLFKMDFKRESDVSGSLWIPLIWMMILGSRMVSLWLNPGGRMASPEAYLGGSPLDRAVFLALIVAGLFILSRREIYWSHILQNNAWIFLFFLYCGISILWSDFSFVSLKRWIKEIGNLVMLLIVITERRYVEAVKTLIRRCMYVLIPLSIVLIKYYRHLGVGYNSWTGEEMLSGVANDKNALGRLCLVGGLFFFWDISTIWRNKNVSVDKKEVFVYISILLMILWLLIKSDSATSLACFIVGVSILFGMGLRIVKRNVKHIGIYVFFTVLVFLILQLLFDITQVFILSLGRDMTLTTRTYIWEKLFEMRTNSWIGSGYESFWLGDRLTKIWTEVKMGLNQAHNGYLEVYLNLGWIGLFLLIGVIVSAYRKISETLFYDFDYGKFQMAILVIVLLYNITEAAFRGVHLTWFVFLLIALESPHLLKLPRFREKPLP